LDNNRPGRRSSRFARGIREAFVGMMSGINTAIPGRVLAFDQSTQLAEVQSSIMMSSPDGDVVAPPIVMVPVHFSGGNQFHVELQVDVGDEGLIIFSQRCIDAWVDQGGDAPQVLKRQFDSTDAIFIPGVRSQPNKITGFSNNGIRIRNKTGNQHIWLKNDGTAEINVSTLVINGNIQHTGDVVQTGDATISGVVTADTVDATTALTSAGKNITVHTHLAGVPPGQTGPNT